MPPSGPINTSSTNFGRSRPAHRRVRTGGPNGRSTLSATTAGEELVSDEGDQRHEHDRPEQGSEEERKENPEEPERSAPPTKTDASSAEAPALYKEQLVRQDARQQGCGVQNPLEVVRR